MALLARATSKNPADWSDRDLLKCVLRNDARGWNELVRRYRPLIYRCITKVTLKYAPTLGQRGPRRDLRRRHDAARSRRDAQAPHLQPGARHQARLVDRHDLGQRRVRLPAQRRSPSAARQGRRRARPARGSRSHAARSADRERALGAPQRRCSTSSPTRIARSSSSTIRRAWKPTRSPPRCRSA